MKRVIATAALLCSTAAFSAPQQCYIEDPSAHPTCVVNAATLDRSIVQYGDDSRLWRVFKKAEAGKPIVIGAIGGSITQGAWATATDKNYVSRVFGWWQGTFQKSKMTLVNAGIGGTNSQFGNQRVLKDLLRYKPDFVIIEYANNDAGTPEMRESYKKLAQTILSSPTHPAVLMLFTMDRTGSNSEDNQIPIGKELHLPMVALREAILPEEKSGQLNPLDRTKDPVHPNDLGHQIIAQLVAYRLQSGLNNMH